MCHILPILHKTVTKELGHIFGSNVVTHKDLGPFKDPATDFSHTYSWLLDSPTQSFSGTINLSSILIVHLSLSSSQTVTLPSNHSLTLSPSCIDTLTISSSIPTLFHPVTFNQFVISLSIIYQQSVTLSYSGTVTIIQRHCCHYLPVILSRDLPENLYEVFTTLSLLFHMYNNTISVIFEPVRKHKC